MRELRAFIICSIKGEHSTKRRRSERVKTSIIDKALEQVENTCGIKIRAEIDHHDSSARDILQGVVEKIIFYDFIFVIIFEENPNVYYELGIAHSAGRDVHILIANDEGTPRPLPFDIQSKQAIEFKGVDLEDGWTEPEKNSLGAASAKIADSIITSLQSEPRERRAFNSEKLDPLGSRHAKYVLYDRFTESLPFHNAQSVDFFAAATKRITLVGTTLLQLAKMDKVWPLRSGPSLNFLELLQVLVDEQRLDLDIFIMHEDNSALPQMLASFVRSDEGAEFNIAAVQQEIRESTYLWRAFLKRVRANANHGRLRLLKIKRGVVYNRLMLTDKALIATPFFYHATTNGTGPAIQVVHDTKLYQLVVNDLEFLEQSPNTEIFDPDTPEHAATG